jgi:hypothetical protein
VVNALVMQLVLSRSTGLISICCMTPRILLGSVENVQKLNGHREDDRRILLDGNLSQRLEIA